MLSHSKVDCFNALLATELAAGKSAVRRLSKWKCNIPDTLIGEYSITPLTSVKMVKSEGYQMNNCCREYIDQCAELTYCLFSIRSRSGERLATLGLICRGGYWRFDQCFGPSNAEVLEEMRTFLDEEGELQEESYATELYYVAHEVVRLMNSAGSQKNSH